MTKKEPLQSPQIGMKVFHEELYSGKECMEVVGIRKDSVELEGDYSGGTHHPCVQRSWLPIEGAFRLRKVCDETVKLGYCKRHNIRCGFPNCSPYLTCHSYYENGVLIEH